MTRKVGGLPPGDEPVPRDVQVSYYRNITGSGALAGATIGAVLGALLGFATGLLTMMAEEARRAQRRKRPPA